MNLITGIALSMIFFCLMYLRSVVVSDAFDQWNYYVGRYKAYCRITYSESEKPQCRIDENEATRGEGIMLFLMFWKIDKSYFFDYKPDWEEIISLYENH